MCVCVGLVQNFKYDLYFMSQVKSYRDVTPFTQYEKKDEECVLVFGR